MTDATLGPTTSPVVGHRSTTALWFLLCLFIFVLPLAEAPKNIAGAAFLLWWAVRVVRTRNVGGRWDSFDTAFALMLASAALSGRIGGYAGDLTGILRVFAVAWAAKRLVFSQGERNSLLLAGGAGLVVSLVFAAVAMLEGHKVFLELPSVGHVNQSALYIAIFAAATLGWALQGLRYGRLWFAAAVAGATVFGIALLVSGSRAAILAYAVFAGGHLLILLWVNRRHARARRPLLYAGVGLLLAAGLVVGLGKAYPHLSGDKLQLNKWANVDSVDHRVRHWHLAIDGWQQKPWFGFGPESFQQLKPEQVCAWRAEHHEGCDPARYATASHGHSLYVSTLVERGVVGLAALAFLLGLWAWALLKTAGEATWSPMWVASAAGFAVVAVGGLFNTTLRVEHGSLALLFLGLWLAAPRKPA